MRFDSRGYAYIGSIERKDGMEMVRLILVAHSRLYRESLQRCIVGHPNLVLMSASGDASDLAKLVRQYRPHVAVIDFALPGALENVDALPITVAESPRVLMLSIPDDRSSVIACARAGAIGILSRDAPLAELASAIASAARGEFAGSPRVCGWLMSELRHARSSAPPSPSPDDLTGREAETLQLIARGLSNREIADQLGIEVSTVKNHVHQILKKMKVRRRGEAVACLSRLKRRYDGPIESSY